MQDGSEPCYNHVVQPIATYPQCCNCGRPCGQGPETETTICGRPLHHRVCHVTHFGSCKKCNPNGWITVNAKCLANFLQRREDIDRGDNAYLMMEEQGNVAEIIFCDD